MSPLIPLRVRADPDGGQPAQRGLILGHGSMRLTGYTGGPPHSTSLTLRVALATSSTADHTMWC